MTMDAQAWVEDGAVLGQGVQLAPMSIVKKYARLGDKVQVDHFAVVGGLPQDLNFDPEVETFVNIGSNTVLREGVTVHRSTRAGQSTIIGNNCFLMANSHVAHDCVLGERVILANGVLLGGHVQVGDGAFLGGNAVVHQGVRVGKGAIVSGGSRVAADLPPYCMATDFNTVAGLNLIGLKRSGISAAALAELRRCYREVYFYPGSLQKKAQAALDIGLGKSEQARHFLEVFIAGSKRGFCRSLAERGAPREVTTE